MDVENIITSKIFFGKQKKPPINGYGYIFQ